MQSNGEWEMRRTVRRATLAIAVSVACLVPVACDLGSGPSDVIDRETFVATYVDLRRAALTSPDGELDDEARTEVLERHGVTEEDLLDFADAHGRDVDFLRSLWTEVEARMDSLASPPQQDPEVDAG